MPEPHDNHETLDVRSTPADSLDAGLAAGFGRPADGPGSVLSELRASLGPLAPVLLKEAEADTALVVKPNSDAMPTKTEAGERYQLSGEIARGGMGAVLRGRDVDLGRDLAVKVLLEKYADRPEVARRFIEEAQIGGQLQHPGVVPVYDIGRFGDRPYFTMKLVKGQTLAAILAERTDSSADRPRLLAIALQVAQAMAYAHAKGVIHRDLKPANIMVGAFGEVQVMDWGLAKVLAEGGVADEERASRAHQIHENATIIRTTRSTGSAGSFGTDTEAGSLLGTPAYMPPEQANGDIANLDRRADVFALGAILCEILTGKPPYMGRSSEEVRRKAANGDLTDAYERLGLLGGTGRLRPVSSSNPMRAQFEDGHENPAKPPDSGATDHPQAVSAGAIDPELIALCKVCLSPEAVDRPKDAQAVADALSAYLAGVQERLQNAERERAVAEARATEERRKRKWQLGLAASIAAFTLLGAAGLATFASVVQAKNQALAKANTALSKANTALTQQRHRAEQREEQAIDAVKRFGDVVKDEPLLKDTPELESLRKKLLQEPLAFFKSLRDQLEADNDTRPESLARLASAAFDLGNITSEIGDKEDARRAYEATRAILHSLADAHPSVDIYQNHLAACHDKLGLLLSEIGQSTEARRSHEAAIQIRQKLADEHPSIADYQGNLASSYDNLGLLLSDTGELDAARRASETAHAIFQKLADAHPTVTAYQTALATNHHNLGSLLQKTGQPAEAHRSTEAALAIRRKLADAYPNQDEFQRALAYSHHNLGALLADTRKLAEARAANEAALAILQRLASAHPSVTEYQSDLASSHYNLGIVLRASGQPAEARRAYEAALAIFQKLADAHPTATKYQSALASTLANLGTLLSSTGEFAEARRAREAALAVEQRLADEHPEAPDYASNLGATLNDIAMIDLSEHRWIPARTKLEQAITWQKKALSANPNNPRYRQFLKDHLTNLIRAATALGNDAEAAEAQRELAEFDATDPGNTALDARVNAVIGGDAPKDNAERLALAQRAYDTKRYAAAAKLWGEAIASDPKLAEDRQTQHRYNAACAAALAASTPIQPSPVDGEGKSATAAREDVAPRKAVSSPLAGEDKGGGAEKPLTDAERKAFRIQALTHLQAELATWSKLLENATPEQRAAIAQTLNHWRNVDTDLASIRDEQELGKLPPDEQMAFTKLWSDAEALHKQAETPATKEAKP